MKFIKKIHRELTKDSHEGWESDKGIGYLKKMDRWAWISLSIFVATWFFVIRVALYVGGLVS